MNQQFPRVPLDISREPLRFTGTAEVVPASLTYEPYYGLKEKAFSLSADPRFLYQSPAHAPAFEELLTGIRRREGLIVLTGEIGTGKTTLIRSVLEHLDRRTFTAFVPDPFVSREDLLKMLLVDFGVVSVADLKQGSLAGASRPDLSYPLYEFLDSLVPLQAFAVLIIDEAQNLPLHLLEEIRILSDLEQREKLLQVVLVGQPELRTHLKMPEMRQVNQRVSVRCELAALDQPHVGEYVKHRLTVASGGDSRIEFSPAALGALFAASGGVPRVINLLCDRALQRGQLAHATVIDSVLIEEAAQVLGLEPVTTSVAVAPTVARPGRDASDAGTPGPSPIVQASAVPIVRIDTGALSPQFLAEFATEEESVPGFWPGVRLWRLAASLLAAALAAAGTAAVAYVYLTGSTIDLSASTLPPSPKWTHEVSTIEGVPPVVNPSSPSENAARTPLSAPVTSTRFSIQVASFGSRARADRLTEELTAAGLHPQVVEIGSPSSATTLLQVRLEGYTTIEDASRDLARIREIPGYADARLVAN